MNTNRSRFAVALVAALTIFMFAPIVSGVSAVSTSSSVLVMYPNYNDAFIDSRQLKVNEPPVVVNGAVYVPLKFVAEMLGFPVRWDEAAKRVELDTPGIRIEFDLANRQIYFNQVSSPFDNMALIQNETLMVKLSWVKDYMGADYFYEPERNRITIVYVKRPDAVYSDKIENSRPVAKFTFEKPSYRIGEPVKYVDLSYDPDAEGIVKYEWTGNEPAFFKPGTYPVTLRVTDAKGQVSEPYTRYITIENDIYMTEFEYPLYFGEPGTFIPADWGLLWSKFMNLPEVRKNAVYGTGRKLLVSDSPELITEKGILYRDVVNGKARLYSHHVNEMVQKIQFVIMATNRTNKPVTVRTTNKGEVYPSNYAHLIGHQASVDFMLGDPIDETVVVPAGRSIVYKQMPDFYPGQGMNAFYDVETDGEIEFSFVAMDPVATPTSLDAFRPLDYVANVRGTFDAADIRWDIDVSNITQPSRLIIGDGESDPFVAGYDPLRREKVTNVGNYGVMYRIHALHPRKMAILILPRGGAFKGPFKINGNFVMVPPSGVMDAFTGVQLLARTTGKEPSLTIEFTPPAGSAFPIDLIFYPLGDKE